MGFVDSGCGKSRFWCYFETAAVVHGIPLTCCEVIAPSVLVAAILAGICIRANVFGETLTMI